ncbi:MAG: DUF6290 family protein [Tissierellia bacterium]|nr:DUF6290 family protein [Tissierellia bacterium]
MAISARLSKQEEELIRNYAKLNNISVSELVRQSVLSRIEDEYDLKVYEEAIEEFNKNPKTYNLDEVKEMLEI